MKPRPASSSRSSKGVDHGDGVQPAGELVQRDEDGREEEQEKRHEHESGRGVGAEVHRDAAGPQRGHDVEERGQPEQADDLERVPCSRIPSA